MSRKNKNTASEESSALALFFLAVIAMPILSVYLLSQQDKEAKDWGIFFAAISVFLWIPAVFPNLLC